MTWYSLNITGGTAGSNFMSQIDGKLPILGSGTPVGHVAAANAGVFYFDTTNKILYLCTQSDGTIGGSTWQAQNFVVSNATTSQPGIVQLATPSEIQTGTNNTKAATPFSLAGIFAKAGANSDINQLTGLTTPLSQGQGGTGFTTFLAALVAALGISSSTNGFVLNNNGTGIGWVPPGTSLIAFPAINVTLLHGSYNFLSVDSITLTLPPAPTPGEVIWFANNAPTAINLTTGDGSLIMGSSPPMTINIANYRFALRYTGNTNGWYLTE